MNITDFITPQLVGVAFGAMITALVTFMIFFLNAKKDKKKYKQEKLDEAAMLIRVDSRKIGLAVQDLDLRNPWKSLDLEDIDYSLLNTEDFFNHNEEFIKTLEEAERNMLRIEFLIKAYVPKLNSKLEGFVSNLNEVLESYFDSLYLDYWNVDGQDNDSAQWAHEKKFQYIAMEYYRSSERLFDSVLKEIRR